MVIIGINLKIGRDLNCSNSLLTILKPQFSLKYLSIRNNSSLKFNLPTVLQ